jgi:hypothetical protein
MRGFKMSPGLIGVLISFAILMVFITVMMALFPTVIKDGFQDLSCYGVACQEGEFCQAGKCIPINPKYTNNYYDAGASS